MSIPAQRLPQETMLRFLLAMLAVMVGVAAVANSLWFFVYSDHSRDVVLGVCRDAAASAECRAASRDRIEWAVAFIPLAAIAGLLSAGVASWWRHRGTTAVPALPSMTALNASAAHSVGTPAVPVRWRRTRPVATARADGMVRRYIEVGPTMLALSATDPQVASAIMRHEYAHHRNTDVVVARWTVAGSGVFVALLGWLLLELWADDGGSSLAITLRGLLLLLVAHLARSSVLRAREFDADVTAAATAPPGDAGVRRALTTTPGRDSGWRRAAAFFSHHPEGRRRIEVVEDPARLYRPQLSDAILVGLTASIGAPVITQLVSDWSGYGRPQLLAAAIGWGAIGVVTGAWVAAALWRHSSVADPTGNPLLGFGAVMAIALLVGNAVFADTLIGTAVSVPHHLVDVLAAVLLMLALPVGVVWSAEVIRRVRRVGTGPGTGPGAGRAAGVGARLVAVCMVATLLAMVGFLYSQATFIGRNPDAVAAAGIDPDLPSTLSSLGQFWNQDWMAWLIPTTAVVGLCLFLSSTPARRWLVPLAAAAGGTGLLAFTRWAFDLNARGLEGGWYSSVNVAASSPVVAGVAIAAIVVVGVHRLEGRIVHAGGFAAIASVLASVAISRLVLPGVDPLFVFRDVVPIAVVASMCAAALVGVREHLAITSVVALAMAAMTMWASTASAGATPSAEVDRGHYQLVLQTTWGPTINGGGPVFRVLQACDDTVSAIPIQSTDAAVATLEFVGMQPSTDDLAELHRTYITVVEVCRDAAHAAEAEGRATLSDDEFAEFDRRLTTFLEGLALHFPGYIGPPADPAAEG